LRYIDGIPAATSNEVSVLFPADDCEPRFEQSPAGHWLLAKRAFPHSTYARNLDFIDWARAAPLRQVRPDSRVLRFEWPTGLQSAEVIAHGDVPMHGLDGSIDRHGGEVPR
jgi:hypothetical protein